MECPRCKKTGLSVIDSRDADTDAIRRRRQCDQCRFRFTTYERIEPIKLTVVKQDGRLEPYSRDKVMRGLSLSAEKRNIPTETLEAIADRVEMQILMCIEDQLTTKRIGEYVMRELKKLDQVAYVRFASVYQSFDTIDAFEQAVAHIRTTEPDHIRPGQP